MQSETSLWARKSAPGYRWALVAGGLRAAPAARTIDEYGTPSCVGSLLLRDNSIDTSAPHGVHLPEHGLEVSFVIPRIECDTCELLGVIGQGQHLGFHGIVVWPLGGAAVKQGVLMLIVSV